MIRVRVSVRRLLTACLALALLAGCGTTVPVTPLPPTPPKGDVVDTARGQLGAPYRSGGDNPRTGFDCSGLVQWCYAAQGHKLPRRTQDLLKVGRPVAKTELRPGDLVFFNVTRKRWGLHVGIYTGRGRFIHSPTPGAHVREESLSERYWVRTYIGARRVLQ